MDPCVQYATMHNRTPARQHTAGANKSETVSGNDCGRREEIKATHLADWGTSHGVLANTRCTAAVAEVRTASGGYLERITSCIHAITDKSKDPKNWRKGKVLERADKNKHISRVSRCCSLEALQRRTVLEAPDIAQRIWMSVGEATGQGHTD